MIDQFALSFNALLEKILGWVNEIVLSLPNIVLAGMVLVAAIFAAKHLNIIVKKGLSRTTSNQTVVGVMSSMAVAIFMLISLFVVLNILNLSDAVTALLGTAGVIGLAIGLALQDPLTNLFSGILMSVREYYQVGDIIESNGHFGTIETITLRSTILLSPEGQTIIIPNKEVIQNPVKNFSRSGRRRVEIKCGVAYGDDLEQAKRIAVASLEESDVTKRNQPVEMFYTDFGDSSVNFVIRFWHQITPKNDYFATRDSAIIALKKAFDKHNITIPFPITTLDFGVVGGVRVDDIYPAPSNNTKHTLTA